MRLQPGSSLGPYEITGEIGAGGMGEVYRARDSRLGREVAIKVLPHDVTEDPARLARFEREARSASSLNHPNIVTVHDFATLNGDTWMVMELIRGESLRDLLARGPLPLKKMLALAAQMAGGLAAAHAAGLVHRDLKPENVMVTSDGTPKIVDFGLVTAETAIVTDGPTHVQVSHAGMVVGTASYMSPEQARGEGVDYRTDHFALGVILYEMAKGSNPFRHATQADTLAAILHEEPEPLHDPVPEGFIDIVGRCLAKKREDRYGSTADLAHDLRRLAESPARSVTAAQRSPNRLWWLAVVAIIVAGIGAWWTSRFREAVLADPIHAAVATPEMAAVLLEEVIVPIALSPDGHYLAVHGVDADGGNLISVHDLRNGTSRVLAENALGAAWSSDSKAIAFFADGKLKTAAIDGGPPRILCDALPEATPTWQGDTILYTQYSKRPGMYRVSSAGGTPQRLESVRGWWPQFLDDEKRFLFLNLILPTRPGQGISHELMLGSLDGSPSRKISAEIDSRVVFIEGYLLFARDGVLLAQPFDPDTARLTGQPKPIVEGLHYFRGTGNAAFAVSKTGLLAWRSAREPSRLTWLDRAGVEAGSIAVGVFNDDGRLSPDGKRYAVGIVDPKEGSSDVWDYDLARGGAERLTFQALDEKAPVWGADGRTIFFRSDGGGGPPDIAQLLLAEQRAVWTYKGPAVEEPQDASSDGKWLLFVDYTLTGADVNLLPLTPTGSPRSFVATPFNELSPRFSPDSRRVAYQSDVSGRPEVYIKMLGGSSEVVRVSKDGGTRPRWRRDGKELFFLGPAGRLMAVHIATDGMPSTPHALFQAAELVNFDVAPDGSRFLTQLEQRSVSPPIHLLLTWQARLHDTP